jgi:hypothetical protein
MIQPPGLGCRQDQGSRRLGRRPIDHAQPEHPPREDAVNGQQVGEALCGPQLRFFGFAAGLEDFVEYFNFPPHSVPVQLLNCVRLDRDR